MKTHAETDTRLQDSPLPKPFYRKLGFQIVVSLVLGITRRLRLSQVRLVS